VTQDTRAEILWENTYKTGLETPRQIWRENINVRDVCW
jgi:hypothetical protein